MNGRSLPPHSGATVEQITELAAAIADQAQAIADGTVVGPLEGASSRLLGNAEVLHAWVKGGVS